MQKVELRNSNLEVSARDSAADRAMNEPEAVKVTVEL